MSLDAYFDCGYNACMPKRTPTAVGEIYHVMNRGVEKRKIFMKPQDYSRFILGLYFFNDARMKYDIWTNLKTRKEQTLSILGSSSIGTPGVPIEEERLRSVDILAFALMPNHFHLILREIKEGGIASFMQKMTGYAKYFNQQYDRVGPLFQGRYKAVHVKDEEQLRTTFVYVHTNPVELKESEWKDFKVKDAPQAINRLKEYRWSSYNDYTGSPIFPAVTERDFFQKLYGGEQECKKAVEEWIAFKAENATDLQ